MSGSFSANSDSRGGAHPGRVLVWWAVGLIVAATVAAYLTSFQGGLVFDDLPGIQDNPTIRDLRRMDLLLVAVGPQGGTLSGRPIPNFTLALNYAMSGTELWSYHATNLAIHVAAALVLFGLVRRTLRQPSLGERFSGGSTELAFAVAILWSLHPLQTESVTYLVQRVESLMGLFYLLTLYCFVRAVDSAAHARAWSVAAFVACLLGMGCKEVMVTAPAVVWLYDRTFVSGTWRESWRRRRWFHLSLLSTWIPLGFLVAASGGRGGTAGFEAGLSAWRYALTQCEVIISYLRLTFWPHPLVFDHHLRHAAALSEVWPFTLSLVGLLAITLYLLVRRPAAGFLAAVFFIILAPTSSVVPVADAMVEHRMYLPLAAVLTLGLLSLYSRWPRAVIPLALGMALACGAATARRNLDYRSPLILWTDTVRKLPENARAQNNLGAYLFDAGRLEEAAGHLITALRLEPTYASAHYNFAKLQEKTGHTNEALEAYESAIRFNPKLTDAHVNAGHLLDRLGRPADAIAHYESALRFEADAADVHAELGASLLKLKRVDEAVVHLQTAVELEPEQAEAWLNLARAYQQRGDPAASRRAGERALRIKPDFPEALYVLGNLDAVAGNFREAIARYQRATDLAPNYIAARNNLANALLMSGQFAAAISHYRWILEQRPDDRAVQENLARAVQLQANPRGP